MSDLNTRIAEVIESQMAKDGGFMYGGDPGSYHPAIEAVAYAAIAEVRAPLEARRKQIASDIERYERELAEFGGVPHVFDPQALYPRRNLLNALIEEMGGERDDK